MDYPSKAHARTELQRRLQGLDPGWCDARVGTLCHNLELLWREEPGQHPALLGFVPVFRGEPAIGQFLDVAAQSGRLFLPQTNPDTRLLRFLPVGPLWRESLQSGAGKTREPVADGPPFEFNPGEKVILLVPGLGFDRRGYRLGRVWGCYDRLLEKLPGSVLRVGVCWSVQLVDDLPQEGWDQPVDVLVTEEGTTRLAGPTHGRL